MPPRWRLSGVASVTGWGLARVECRLATVGRRPQGIADGADEGRIWGRPEKVNGGA